MSSGGWRRRVVGVHVLRLPPPAPPHWLTVAEACAFEAVRPRAETRDGCTDRGPGSASALRAAGAASCMLGAWTSGAVEHGESHTDTLQKGASVGSLTLMYAVGHVKKVQL